ncbi:AGAP005245-PC [Anopheles gambiae str. PEST]|uniref:AGAP005245-PC n=1 Tax=Anopheles gambiae TaxID=7165 RepID=A7UTB8_ANOGA|nr:AGAP005245-PC [Anopheles gambiae str. PEST]
MDDDQQFCLRWNNHQSTLISVFDTLLENGTLVDCTLAAEGKLLKAHKVVLSACSPYFATILSQQYDKHPIFILKDVKFQELRAMMDYMYRGEVNISQDQLAALLKAAESLQIKGLSDNRSSSSSGTAAAGGGVHQKQSDAPAAKTLQPPVPASKASGLTIENKRSLKSELLESDVSGSREGSTSPTSRKRKKVRRRSVDTNNLLIDNHDQHSNSSSHSMHTAGGANVAAAVAAAGAPAANVASSLSSASSTAAAGSNTSANVLSVAAVAAAAVLKKTETVQQAAAETLKLQKQQAAAAAAAAAAQSSDDEERCGPGSVATGTEHDDGNDLSDNEHDGDGGSSVKSGSRHHHLRDGSRRGKTSTSSMGEMMIEPKSEYEDVQDENVEDLTMDDEDLMDELDQAGPSHGGDVSTLQIARPSAKPSCSGSMSHVTAIINPSTSSSSFSSSCIMSPDDCGFSDVCPRTSTRRLLNATLRAAAAVAAASAAASATKNSTSSNVLPCSPAATTALSSASDSFKATCCSSGDNAMCTENNSTIAASICGSNNSSNAGCGGAENSFNCEATVTATASKTTAAAAASASSSAFKCPRCPRAYGLSYTLERHMKYECGVAKQFGCFKCGKRFSRKDILKAHISNTRLHCAAAAVAAASVAAAAAPSNATTSVVATDDDGEYHRKKEDS